MHKRRIWPVFYWGFPDCRERNQWIVFQISLVSHSSSPLIAISEVCWLANASSARSSKVFDEANLARSNEAHLSWKRGTRAPSLVTSWASRPRRIRLNVLFILALHTCSRRKALDRTFVPAASRWLATTESFFLCMLDSLPASFDWSLTWAWNSMNIQQWVVLVDVMPPLKVVVL